MEPFTHLTAIAIPIDQANIDTDQIIPARFLGKPRPQQAAGFFHDTRLDPSGRPREGVGPPFVPVDRVLRVLLEVGAGGGRETVGHR